MHSCGLLNFRQSTFGVELHWFGPDNGLEPCDKPSSVFVLINSDLITHTLFHLSCEHLHDTAHGLQPNAINKPGTTDLLCHCRLLPFLSTSCPVFPHLLLLPRPPPTPIFSWDHSACRHIICRHMNTDQNRASRWSVPKLKYRTLAPWVYISWQKSI